MNQRLCIHKAYVQDIWLNLYPTSNKHAENFLTCSEKSKPKIVKNLFTNVL